MSYGPASSTVGQCRACLPANHEQAFAILDQMTGSRYASVEMVNDIRWPGAELGAPKALGGPRKPILLAQAPAATMTDAGTALWSSGGKMTVERTVGGTVLRIGGSIVTAAMLLQELDAARERKLVLGAIRKFSLDESDAVDVLAARAYVWADLMAPMRFWNLPWSGPVHDQAAESIMWYEREHPGTLGEAVRGNRAAMAAIAKLVDDALLPIPQEILRASAVNPALSSSSRKARALLGATTAMQQWRAHHLIPFGVVAALPVPIQQAIVASGWVMDSLENLIALPANYFTFTNASNSTELPIHSGSHPRYDADVRLALLPKIATARSMTSVQVRAALLGVEALQRGRLFDRRYHIRVH